MSRSNGLRLLPIVLPILLLGCGHSSPSAYRAPPVQQPVLSESLNLRECSSSTMGGTLLAVCDPVLLEQAWEDHTLTEPGTLDVKIAGRKVRVGSNPGLTQVVPDDGIGSLLVPAKVTLLGTASAGSHLYISARSHKPDHWANGEALFGNLGLTHGGTATIDVRLEGGRVAFVFRLADGSVLKPLRRSHVEGPGPRAELPPLPDHYADTPEQGVRTYVAAINAHDGKTICELWTADLRARFADEHSPCWANVTGLIGYGGEADSPTFQRAQLLSVDEPYTKTSYGVSFTAVPVSIRSHYLTSRQSPETADRETTIWFRKTRDGWRIANDAFFNSSGGAAVPPDPYAAQHAKQAEQRKEHARLAARARSRIRLTQAPSCSRPALTLQDPANDVGVRTGGSARGGASSDIVRASLALPGRRGCFSVTFRGQPLAGNERIELSLSYAPSNPAQRRYARFEIDDDYPTADGLHAGFYDTTAGSDGLSPADARVGVNGNTVTASFELPPSFPTLGRARLAQLGWTVSATARSANDSSVFDSAEAGFTAAKVAAAAAKAERARQAKEKAAEQAREATALAPTLARLGSGSVRCPGRQVHRTDTASDVRPAGATTIPRQSGALLATSDLRSAAVAVSGRHVCFSVSFAKPLFGQHQRRYSLQLGLKLTYKATSAPYLRIASFGVETNVRVANGLTYAGLFEGGAPVRPAHAHVEVRTNTLSADFDLERDFPSLRPAQLNKLTWRVTSLGSDLGGRRPATVHPSSYDELPNNADAASNVVSPEVRQSDGKTITPY